MVIAFISDRTVRTNNWHKHSFIFSRFNQSTTILMNISHIINHPYDPHSIPTTTNVIPMIEMIATHTHIREEPVNHSTPPTYLRTKKALTLLSKRTTWEGKHYTTVHRRTNCVAWAGAYPMFQEHMKLSISGPISSPGWDPCPCSKASRSLSQISALLSKDWIT